MPIRICCMIYSSAAENVTQLRNGNISGSLCCAKAPEKFWISICRGQQSLLHGIVENAMICFSYYCNKVQLHQFSVSNRLTALSLPICALSRLLSAVCFINRPKNTTLILDFFSPTILFPQKQVSCV